MSCYINGIGVRGCLLLKQIYQISYAKYHLSVKKKTLNDFKQKLFLKTAHSGIVKINSDGLCVYNVNIIQ